MLKCSSWVKADVTTRSVTESGVGVPVVSVSARLELPVVSRQCSAQNHRQSRARETYTPATFMCVSASTEHIYHISMQRTRNQKTDRCYPPHNNEAWHEFYSKVSLSERRRDLVAISVGLLLSHIHWGLRQTWLRYRIVCLVIGSMGTVHTVPLSESDLWPLC